MTNKDDGILLLKEENVVTPSMLASMKRRKILAEIERENNEINDIFRSIEFDKFNKISS